MERELKSRLTVEDVKQMERETITPAIAAEVIGCDAHELRLQARFRPDLLGFPVIVCGTRTKIPRKPFIRFMEGETP